MSRRTGFRFQVPGVRRSGEFTSPSGRAPHHPVRGGAKPPLHRARLLPLAGSLAALLLAAMPASGQVATGVPPFGSFSSGSFDTVNNANLNVHFAIPIVNKAGRGMPFTYTLSYDSAVWYPLNGVWTPVANWGWRGVTEVATGYLSHSTSQRHCIDPNTGFLAFYNLYGNWTYHDSFGIAHRSAIVTSDNSPICGVNFGQQSGVALDDSGYTIAATGPLGRVSSRSGDAVNAPSGPTGSGSVTDSNGNTLSANPSGGTTNFTDTLGLTALAVTGVAPNPTTFTYTGPNGSATYTVKYTSYNVQTNFGCSSPGVTEYGATQQYLVSEIDLPDQASNPSDKYTFTYEVTPNDTHSPHYVTGRLYQVTLPTGGTISYTYSGGSNGITCADGSAATLTRTVIPGGSGTSGTWTYAHSENGTAWTTTITDPQNNQTVMNFQTIYETKRTVKQGSSTVLATVDTCYNGASIPCTSTAITLPISNRTVQLTLPNLSPSKSYATYNTYGLPTETDEYAYGGALVRKTTTTYTSCGVTNSAVVDRPCTLSIYDSGGTLGARTMFAYDANGNRLSETRYATATVTISRTFTYGSYGVLTGATDFNSHSTTYSSFTCASSTAFPQSISSGGLTTSLQWDCNGGVVTSAIDPNGRTTSYSYDTTHNFWRLSGTTFPDGGSVSTTYTSPTELDSSTAVTGSLTRNDQIVLDGLGRVTTTSLVNDPDGQTYVGTQYDSLGRTEH
jgi:YD repeat-containing protein